MKWGTNCLALLTNKGVGTLFSAWPWALRPAKGYHGLNDCTGLNDDVSRSFYGHWSVANTAMATVD